MIDQQNYVNKENSNDANLQTQSSIVGRKIVSTNNVVVSAPKNKKFPIPLMQKSIKQRIGDQYGDRYEVKEVDFDSPEIYAPNFTIESITDKNKSTKQTRSSTSKNVPTQSTKSKSSQKNSSRQPNTTKSTLNGQVDLFFKHNNEYPQPKQIQNQNMSGYTNGQQQLQVRIAQKSQEKHGGEQQHHKRTVSKHTGGHKSTVILSNAGKKKQSKKKTISLKGLNNTQTTSSDLNTISQIPSDSINIFNQFGLNSSSNQQYLNNQQIHVNGNQTATNQRSNNHINTAQQLNLLSQNPNHKFQDGTSFYQNQMNHHINQLIINQQNNQNHHDNAQVLHTSNTATFEAHGTIDVEEYKIKSNKKGNQNLNNYLNEEKRQRTSASKKKNSQQKRQNSRSKSVGKKNQPKVNASMSQGNTTFTKSQKVDLNKTDTLNNTNKSFSIVNNKKKTQRSPSGGKQNSHLNQISIDNIRKKKIQEIIHKQIELEKEKAIQQKKLQLQIDNETIRINNGQRFLKQKVKKDPTQFPWGFNQIKKHKQQERSQERMNNTMTNNNLKLDDQSRRERLGLSFLNHLDENTMQSIKKKNNENQREFSADNHSNKIPKAKTFEEHQNIVAFMEYKKQVIEVQEKQEQEAKEYQKIRIEDNLKRLNETIRRQQRSSRSKSVSKKKSFIINGADHQQSQNSYYQIQQGKNRSTSGDAYSMSRVSSELFRQQQALQNQLFFQKNQLLNQPCGDIQIDFEALENEQNSDRKFSVLNNQCKSILHQALEDQKVKQQQNLNSSILSQGKKADQHLNQTLQQNYFQNSSQPGKMSSGQTSLHSFITKNSRDQSNQKVILESNRNQSIEQKKQRIFEQFINLGQRFQSLHIGQQNQKQQNQILQNIQQNTHLLSNQDAIQQQQQLQQIMQNREQYEEYLKQMQNQYPSHVQDMYNVEQASNFEENQHNDVHLPSESDVDGRLVIEEFKSSSSSIGSDYSEKKNQNNNNQLQQQQQANIQQYQNGQQKQNTSKQNYSNRYSNQDSQINYENIQSNHQVGQDDDEDYEKIAYESENGEVHIISPLEFNRGQSDVMSSQNQSPGNQQWINQGNNNQHILLKNQVVQDVDNSQRSKPVSSVSNQKNQRSEFMYNQSSQSFHDIKDSSRQQIGNSGKVDDSSKSNNTNNVNPYGAYGDDDDEDYENDEEELKNLKEIRDIEQQALLNSTNVNLNKTNNISIISNQPLIINNNMNHHENKKRKLVKNPVLQYILDLMDGFVQQEVIDEKLQQAMEQMQQAAMLIQKVWKGYYTRIILGYRLQQILQEENNESFDLTEEQEDELLRMQILQYQIDNNEQWTQEEFEEYFLKFKQKNALEKEKRRQQRQQMSEVQMRQHQRYQEQHYDQSTSGQKSHHHNQRSDVKQQHKQDDIQQEPPSSENRHIIHSASSYDLQHMNSRKKEEEEGDYFDEELDSENAVQNKKHLTTSVDQKASVSNKQTDEILNTEDLLMDEEQYIKSAQRYQMIKETQPHLIDHQVDINYDELMKIGINTKKFSPGDQSNNRQPQQQQKMNIPYHPIDPRYQAQQKMMQANAEQEAYEMEGSDQNQYDYEHEEEEDDQEEMDDQQILHLLKQGMNLNQLGGQEGFDIQNKKLLIQDGDGVYELDLSQLPGINNLHFKEDQYAHSMRDQQQSGQNYSDSENLDSYSQRKQVTTKEVGIGEEEYVNFGNEDAEDEKPNEANNIKPNNKEKEFNKVQNISMKRKVNLGIEIDDDNSYSDQAQINFLNNNLSNQGASKMRDQIPQQAPVVNNNQKNNQGQASEKQPEAVQQQGSAKNNAEEGKKLDQTGEKVKQYNNYMENLEFSEKKAASVQQQSEYNEESGIQGNEEEGEEEYEEYEIDFEQLLMKEKYQDEEGNIFIIENGDRIYLGDEEINALNEYAAEYMQRKRVKEENSFENDHDESDDEDKNIDAQYEDEEQEQQEEDEEDIYDSHIQNNINHLYKDHHRNQPQYDQYDNGSSDEAINVNKTNSKNMQLNKNNQFILQNQNKQEETQIEKEENKHLNNSNLVNKIYNNEQNVEQQQQDDNKVQINIPDNQSSFSNQSNINSQQQSSQNDQFTIKINNNPIDDNKSINNETGKSDSRTSRTQNCEISQGSQHDDALKTISTTLPIQNQMINNQNLSQLSPQKSTQNNLNELQGSGFKQIDTSYTSHNNESRQTDLKVKQEQIKQWAEIVNMLEEYDQNNPQSILEMIKLKSQHNFKQLANEIKNQDSSSQNILDSPHSQRDQEKLSINVDENSKSHRSAGKKKLILDLDKIEDEFQQKVRQQTFSVQDHPQIKKDQKQTSSQQLKTMDDEPVIDNDSQSFEDITSASKMKKKFLSQRGSNIDQLIPSFQFSSKTLKSLTTPGKQNMDTEENEDGSSATGSLFEDAPFLVFYQKYREVMKKDDINQILMFREQALIKRHNIEEKNLKKNLEINRISPRTYDIKRLELEKMVTKEREQISKTRSDIERTWTQTAQTIARTQRDLMFLQKMKASQELNPTHAHNPHQMLMLNINSPPPLFTEGNESLSCRNPMYSSTSSSAFKQRRVLFKSESETETEGTWKHYHRTIRHSLNDVNTPESSNNQNIIVIDQYEPVDISKKNNKMQEKTINFSKTQGSTLTGDDKSLQNTTERSQIHTDIAHSARPVSASSASDRLKTDQSQRGLNSEQSEKGVTMPKDRKTDFRYESQSQEEDEQYDVDEDFEINDSQILEKKLQELNIHDSNETNGDKEREEFEENYKNLESTAKKIETNQIKQNEIPNDFSLSQQQENEEFDEKNIYSSSSKLYDASVQKQSEEYFNQLLQQTPLTHPQKSTNSKESSQEQISNRINQSAEHEEDDITDQSKDFSSVSSSQKVAITIQKKLFSKDDNIDAGAVGYNIQEDDFEDLSEDKSLEMSSSLFQKTPSQITKGVKNIPKGAGQRNFRESNEHGEFYSENMFSSASGNLQGVIAEKNATALSSIDWDSQLSARQSVEENEFKQSGNRIQQNQIGKHQGGFEKKNIPNGGNNNILMAEELDTNIEQYHLQNSNYQNQAQNLCANYHNNYSLTESLNTCFGQVSANSAIAQSILQSNQIHSSYKQIFPKSSNKSSAEKFSDFNYSSSKEATMNFVDDEDTAQKLKTKDQHFLQNNQQTQQQQQPAYIYDMQDDDYEIDLEYETTANKSKTIAPIAKQDPSSKSRHQTPSSLPLQTPNEESLINQGKDVNIQNLSSKYDSEVFVEESVEEHEKDILQFSNLINPDLIQNMQPIATNEDCISEESEIAEPVNMNQTTNLPNRATPDDEIPSSYTPKDQYSDYSGQQDYENYEDNGYSLNTEQQLQELHNKAQKNQNVDFICDDLINNLMDEVTEEFSNNQPISTKLKNCSTYLENLQAEQKLLAKEAMNYQNYGDNEFEDEEGLIQEEFAIAQKQLSQPSQALKIRMKGISTQKQAVKEYLTKLSKHILENYLDTFVERINYSLGPTAIEMLKFLHFTDQNYSLDSQLDNSSDFSMQHSAVLVTDLYSTFEMLLLEEKKQQKLQLKLEREENKLQSSEDNDDTDEEDVILSEQFKVSLKDITHIHNKVIFDAFNEALDNHRLYGLKGRPFPWKVDPTKINSTPITHDKIPLILKNSVEKVIEWSECQCGFIFDRPDTQIPVNQPLNEEYISQVKEKRLTDMLHQEVKEAEEKWIIYDDEYTEIQVEISELVFQELLLELDVELNKINNKYLDQQQNE